MRVADLKNRKVLIWGLGHEGKSAAFFIRKILPDLPLVFADEADGPPMMPDMPDDSRIVRDAAAIAGELDRADILVKSPGVSLYHPLVRKFQDRGGVVTSLLNLWLAEPRKAKVLCVTGTKGKSTTSALLTHTLGSLGNKAVVVGNIGVPVTEAPDQDCDYVVVEVSSYQAALFSGSCEVAVLTSLFPEHLDWHKSLASYYRDKLNLLAHAKKQIVNAQALPAIKDLGLIVKDALTFNDSKTFHAEGKDVYDGGEKIGALHNDHLSRAHNLSNVCGVLTVIRHLGLDIKLALQVMESYRGLPHRQEELGKKDGVLFVNDSIATTPQATIAALEAYAGKTVTLIVGGYDRGIDYGPLIDYILAHKIHAVLCLDVTGRKIHDALAQKRPNNLYMAASMPEIVALAKQHTPKDGVILLSPASPSYGLFKDFIERGQSFAAECGFKAGA